MNVTQLKTFVTLADSGSFAETAIRQGVTRPAVTNHIKAFETKYDVRLFTRNGRSIEVSAFGERLLPQARHVLEMLDEIETTFGNAMNLTRSHLTVGVGEPFLGIDLISAFVSRYPGVRIQAKESDAPALMKDLDERKLDIAILALTEPDPRFENFLYNLDELLICVSKNHVWAGRQSIELSELQKQTMVLPGTGTTCRRIFDAALSSAAVEPIISLEFDEWDPIKEAVAHGIGAGILQGVHLAADPRLTPLRVTGTDLRVPQYVVCPAEYTQLKSVRAFLETVQEMQNISNQ